MRQLKALSAKPSGKTPTKVRVARSGPSDCCICECIWVLICAFKTDLNNTYNTAEYGASRNFQPWREERTINEEDKLARLEVENNPIKALENQTQNSKREIDVLDALRDICARNAQNERRGVRGFREVHGEHRVLGNSQKHREDCSSERMVCSFPSHLCLLSLTSLAMPVSTSPDIPALHHAGEITFYR